MRTISVSLAGDPVKHETHPSLPPKKLETELDKRNRAKKANPRKLDGWRG